MKLRLAEPSDAQAIADIQTASWQVAYAGLVPAEALAALAQPQPQRAARWAQWLSEPTPLAGTLVAEDDAGSVTGFCVVGPARDQDSRSTAAELVALGVSDHHQRQGIGRALVEQASQQARERGLSELSVWVTQSAAKTIVFLEALGFRTDGTQRLNLHLTQLPLTENRYRLAIAAEPAPTAH